MNISVVGTGYVGLVTGTCLSESGHYVTCLDIDSRKIESLKKGSIPIYEPGLSELVVRNQSSGRLLFTTEYNQAIPEAEIIFLAVGTPPGPDGSADLSGLWSVVDSLAPILSLDSIVVTKSTVPVGTCAKIEARLLELTGKRFKVASNPEFLKEGSAIEDFQKPDRVVVGVRSNEVAESLRSVYAPFLRTDKPFIVMNPESSEMTKYVANALLATKISFINEVANLCELVEADIDDVRRGIGHDARIGFAFLFPGVGYGGSCFPKDVQALASTAREKGMDPIILDSVHETNIKQKKVLFKKISDFFGGSVSGKKVALWGLSFKPKTDDIREAPAMNLIDDLVSGGASLFVHDPEAIENVRAVYGEKIKYASDPMEAVKGADCLAILTEWSEYRSPDLDKLSGLMAQAVVFDGRNLFCPQEMRKKGFKYYCIGKSPK